MRTGREVCAKCHTPCFDEVWLGPDGKNYHKYCFNAKDAEIAALREVLRWIPVEEGLPDGKSDVLIFVLDDYEGNKNYITIDCPPFVWNEEVTHWMPLPQPPTEAERVLAEGQKETK